MLSNLYCSYIYFGRVESIDETCDGLNAHVVAACSPCVLCRADVPFARVPETYGLARQRNRCRAVNT